MVLALAESPAHDNKQGFSKALSHGLIDTQVRRPPSVIDHGPKTNLPLNHLGLGGGQIGIRSDQLIDGNGEPVVIGNDLGGEDGEVA